MEHHRAGGLPQPRPNVYRSAQISSLEFDINQKSTFAPISYWLKELQTNADDSVITMICGNKVDLDNSRQI
jgi:GTPase SAR1 family protein